MKLNQFAFAVAAIAAICIFLSPLSNSAYAQSAIQKLFGITEPRTQDITPYWSESLNTLLEIYCTDLRCNAELADTNEAYVFKLKDVEIPLSEIGGGDTTAELLIKSVRASMTKDGLKSLNGFPEKIDLSIEGITLNDNGIKELAAALSQNDKRLQRLIARELAKESLQFSASLTRQENIFELDAEISLMSGDTIGIGLSLVAPEQVLAYLVKDEVSATGLAELEEPSLRGAVLVDSLAWNHLQNLSIRDASVRLLEVKLLDKIFAPILLEKKSVGEKQFWANMKKIGDPIAAILQNADRFEGTKADIIGVLDFYTNWRSKGGVLTSSIRIDNLEDVISEISDNSFDPKNPKNCNVAASIVPVLVAGAGVALPYLPDVEKIVETDNVKMLLDDPEAMKAFTNLFGVKIDEFVVGILKNVNCNPGIISISYKRGV